MGKNLPPRVFLKNGRYYLVRAEGAKRVWKPLTRERDGLPELYRALAAIESEALADDRMPAMIETWKREVMARHADKTQINELARCTAIATAFAEFRAREVTAPDAAEFLRQFRDRPRTHNLYRALLRELMRFAVEKGHRADNPIGSLRTMSTPPRHRYITDSELRRIQAGACRGDDGLKTRSGRMIAALVTVAYLTGQRIGDLLELRWERDPDDLNTPHITSEGLRFRPSKTRGSTGTAVLIQWTPRLVEAIERLRAMHAERLLKKRADQRIISGHVFTTQAGTPLTYSAVASAWRRACARAKVQDAHIHDLRAKALTDKDAREGMAAARAMGAHSTEAQTADYVRHRTARKTRATR